MTADLADGQSVPVRGTDGALYTLRNTGGLYSCSCAGWMHQNLPLELRSCEHLRGWRGEAAEAARLAQARRGGKAR